MTTSQKIQELSLTVKNANTTISDGRQVVANGCKELYKLIEKEVEEAGFEWMLKGMYRDLCEGNFSEPFMCEKQKITFAAVQKVYEDNIV